MNKIKRWLDVAVNKIPFTWQRKYLLWKNRNAVRRLIKEKYFRDYYALIDQASKVYNRDMFIFVRYQVDIEDLEKIAAEEWKKHSKVK